MLASATHKTTTNDPTLNEKAKWLKQSLYFTHDNDGPQTEKQLIFLVLAGLKPAAEVGSFYMEWLSPTNGESRPDSQAGVTQLLKDLGLCYGFRSPYDGIVTVPLDQTLIETGQTIDRLTGEADIYRAYGQLYGYPETAIEAAVAEWACDKPGLMSVEVQQQVERQSGLRLECFIFRFSRAH
jgi:hypothetical protein